MNKLNHKNGLISRFPLSLEILMYFWSLTASVPLPDQTEQKNRNFATAPARPELSGRPKTGGRSPWFGATSGLPPPSRLRDIPLQEFAHTSPSPSRKGPTPHK